MASEQLSEHSFTLEELGLVDAPTEGAFDNLTRLASMMLGAPVSLVSMVQFAKDRQYFKSYLGLPEPWATDRQTPLSHSFCQHVVREDQALVVDDAPKHPLVKDNLAIPDLNVIAYLGVPIYSPTREPIGSFCVIDGIARAWSDEDVATLKQLASCVTDAIRLKATIKTNEILLRERKAAMDELERSNSELDEFASIAAHDLKQPLRAVANHLNALSEDQGDLLDEDSRKRLQRTIKLGQRMEKLIADLLYFSRLGRGDLTSQTIGLDDVILGIKADLAEALSERNARIELQEPLPKIVGHPAHINALFRNLISNGIKYNDSAKKIVEIGCTSVVDDEQANSSRTFYVKDNGIGIDDQSRDDVFRMFKRLNSEKAYGEGTGAGLAFVRKIVETHGGQLRLESKLGEGTTFFVTLPSEAPATKEQAA